MSPTAVFFLLPTLQLVRAAAPASSKTLAAGEATARQVRASKEHVAVEVQSNGHLSEAAPQKMGSATARMEAKPHKAVDQVPPVPNPPEAAEQKTVQEKTAEEVPPVPRPPEAAATKFVETKPDDAKTMNFEKEALFIHTAEAEESWKSAFFFFASLVLIVILAAACVFRLKNQADQKQEPTRQALQASSSSAPKLSSNINDSSSTSDSGEKIAMLFDRVRQSLEDLSHEKGSGSATTGPGDVAGGKGGQI
jgi:hypothetical protein